MSMCELFPWCSHGSSYSRSDLRKGQLLVLVDAVCADLSDAVFVGGGMAEQPQVKSVRPASKQKQNALKTSWTRFCIHLCAMRVQSLFHGKHFWLLSVAESSLCPCAWVCLFEIEFICFLVQRASIWGCSSAFSIHNKLWNISPFCPIIICERNEPVLVFPSSSAAELRCYPVNLMLLQ